MPATNPLGATMRTLAPLNWIIGLVGYGEVGRILAEDLRQAGVSRVLAHDVKLNGAEDATIRAHAAKHGVELVASHAQLATGADLVISAITASQTVSVAKSCAPGVRAGTWFVDLNSASPGAKRNAAEFIDAAGGRYVEGAVMTSVPPYRIRVPLLLGGQWAVEITPLLEQLGFCGRAGSPELGVVSATKMCRSVMIKGLEAMVIESFTAARAYGVEDALLTSLRETFPGIDWEKQGAYFFQRVIEHGRRRAEEMSEAAQTVREAGLAPWLAGGAAQRQGWMADLADTGVFGARGSEQFAHSADWRVEADRLLAAIKNKGVGNGA